MEANKPVRLSVYILKIIWTALLLSQIVYLILAFLLYGEPLFIVPEELNSFSKAFLILSLSFIVMGFILFNLLLKPVKKSVSYKDAKQKYFIPFVVRLALIEAFSLLGFAYSSMLKQNLMMSFTFVAILSFLFCFPTESKIKKEMR